MTWPFRPDEVVIFVQAFSFFVHVPASERGIALRQILSNKTLSDEAVNSSIC